jgi:drug/metabolite transporter (DMT)-like permease
MGMGGVALVAGLGGIETDASFVPAVCACLGAAACYGLAGVYVRLNLQSVTPQALAGASQLIAGAALLPLLGLDTPSTAVSASVVMNLLALAVLCSAVAYLLYYRLLADTGPSRALTVVFLIPAFAMVWGRIFLGERITATMVLGTLVIVGGTLLVAGAMRLPLRWPARRKLPVA